MGNIRAVQKGVRVRDKNYYVDKNYGLGEDRYHNVVYHPISMTEVNRREGDGARAVRI
jgi:hypothetical protein